MEHKLPYQSAIRFESNGRTHAFLQSGDVHSFTAGGNILNGYIGSQKEGSVNNLYLRVYENGKVVSWAPLLGIQAGGKVEKSQHLLRTSGETLGVCYQADFYPGEKDTWLWHVQLDTCEKDCDIVYVQDIGVASMGGVITNELYMAQYLGHTVFEDEHGFHIASRQNQPQSGGSFPYLQQGMIQGKAVHFATDGTQFFGLSYKETNIPALIHTDLPDVNKQYELSITALQTHVFSGKTELTFYGLYQENHAGKVEVLENIAQIQDTLRAYCSLQESFEPIAPVAVKPVFGAPYAAPAMDDEDLLNRYDGPALLEKQDGKLLSFFTRDHAHVVTKAKELLCERPHGTIVTTLLHFDHVDENLLTSTHYIYGLFNAQTVIGNTTQHKLISTQRGLLNLLKNPGQRLYVKIDGVYRLLTLPAAFEMGMNYSVWLYPIGDDMLTVRSYAVSGQSDMVLEVESEKGVCYDMLLTTQLVLGDAEFNQGARLETLPCGTLRILPDEELAKNCPYPDWGYDLCLNVPHTHSDDRIFFEDELPRNSTLLTTRVDGQKGFKLVIHGYLYGAEERKDTDFATEKQRYLNAYGDLIRHFNVTLPKSDGTTCEYMQKVSQMAWWYTHNAMVHFTVPHGLEQPGGAAWGTRDVCQGPFEFFLATGRHDMARDVLLRIFSHQFSHDGQWPQWFMFDRYEYIYADECHGDVVFWPLKCLADYIDATGDYAVMKEVLPYLGSEEKAPLRAHLEKSLSSIRSRFLPGTHLISYAGGDWDDTLRPISKDMQQRMISAWTQALAYQVLNNISRVLNEMGDEEAPHVRAMADGVQHDFEHRLIKDGVVAGFAIMEKDGTLTLLLHPDDTQTGIHTRLLPLTRSVIANMVSPAQAEKNIDVVHEKLRCPDGVRLMDNPSRYDGGVSHLFARAEQAANVGREISLQYVHAHIRYIEAMAHLGKAQDAWRGLFTILPIRIQDTVKNAMLRQSNMYCSSSEGDFNDRYQFSREYHRLYEGSIPVKAGWRLYSSGSGILLHQIISNMLGVRFEADALVLDPVLNAWQNGLRMTYDCFGKQYTFIFQAGKRLSAQANGSPLPAEEVKENPYRSGGIRIMKDALPACGSEIIVEYPV